MRNSSQKYYYYTGIAKEYLAKFFVGFSYGSSFPLTLVILDFWLKDAGVSNTIIGLFSLFHLPFTLKFVWGVFIENYNIPYLTQKIGRSRSWIVVGYSIMIIGIIGLGCSDPKSKLCFLIFFASLTALGDGCKDVTLYPYQIDEITKNQLGYVAGIVCFGHKIGMIITKVSILHFAHFFNWNIAYLIAAFAMFVSMIVVLSIKPPDASYTKAESNTDISMDADIGTYTDAEEITKSEKKNFLLFFKESLNKSFLIPFQNIRKEQRFFFILVFYKSADFMMRKMSGPFFIDIGFSKLEIANIVQLFGSISVIIGGLAGGYFIKRIGINRSMMCFGLFHAISFALYLMLVYAGADVKILSIIILLEAISGGSVTTAFLAFFYTTCKTGSIYAFLWAVHELSGMFFMGISGIIVDSIGWSMYFILVPLIYALILMISLCKCARNIKAIP